MKIKPGAVRWVDDLSMFDPKAVQVVVEVDPSGQVLFQVLHEQEWFTERYSEFLDERSALRNTRQWGRASYAMAADGFDVLILVSAEDTILSAIFDQRS